MEMHGGVVALLDGIVIVRRHARAEALAAELGRVVRVKEEVAVLLAAVGAALLGNGGNLVAVGAAVVVADADEVRQLRVVDVREGAVAAAVGLDADGEVAGEAGAGDDSKEGGYELGGDHGGGMGYYQWRRFC